MPSTYNKLRDGDQRFEQVISYLASTVIQQILLKFSFSFHFDEKIYKENQFQVGAEDLKKKTYYIEFQL